MSFKKFSSLYNCTVGVGILSWKSNETLEKTLESYKKVNFKNYFDEIKIIFQEISENDKILAEKYGFDYVGLNNNFGIQGGHKEIYKNMTTDYVLILENDNPIVESESIMYERLSESLKLLESNQIDMMRLRHRWNFGEGFSLEKYFNFFDVKILHENCQYLKIKNSNFDFMLKKLKQLFYPSKLKRLAGYSLYCEKYPEKLFPQYIKKLDENLFVVDSSIIPWTNQSVLLRRRFYGKLIDFAEKNPSSRCANGFQDLEKPLNCRWWRKQNFKIGVGEGIFSHNRFDDSWRITHPAFNNELLK